MARVQMIRVTGAVLEWFCKPMPPGRRLRIESGVPSDARVVRMNYDVATDEVCVVFEHPSFPEVIGGDAVPWHEPPVFSISQDEPDAPVILDG